MAELVDAQDLGSCALRIRVRVPSLAPFSISRKTGGFFYCSENPFCQCFVRQKGFIVRRKGMSKPPVKLGVDKSHLIEKERTS